MEAGDLSFRMDAQARMLALHAAQLRAEALASEEAAQRARQAARLQVSVQAAQENLARARRKAADDKSNTSGGVPQDHELPMPKLAGVGNISHGICSMQDHEPPMQAGLRPIDWLGPDVEKHGPRDHELPVSFASDSCALDLSFLDDSDVEAPNREAPLGGS